MKVLTEYKRMQQSTTPWRTTHLQSQRNLLMKLTLIGIHPFQPLLLLPPRLLNPQNTQQHENFHRLFLNTWMRCPISRNLRQLR